MSNSTPEAPFKITPIVFQVLLSLADGDAHAYALLKSIPERTGGEVKVAPGSLHFTLAKLLEAGMIEETSGPPSPDDGDSRRRYYRLTPHGRQVLSREATLLAEIVEYARRHDLVIEKGPPK